ncbi:peptidoglycan-binding domain-containing protein [Streptomyces sp. HNM0574]|uniref:peptidoglycan-binding protein n=1 Tax=Streptomyces sp. HNM0574 TaxID=2714954 RepID=UPI00146D527E|nr:peptidoglycan-binding domain-containing protein [Streptomyces sp. HNM0574]NLU70104.1 peptidoglycan-binding protein [Streptomyces sp. HNM0574]
MTAHRCCPECGAERGTAGGADCSCTGPFAADHVDPMHIRPYVDLPEGDASAGEPGRTQPDLEPFARCGTSETAEMPAVPAASAAPRTDETPELVREAGARAPHHRRRRRRTPLAVLAAVGVVTVLGAGVFGAEFLGDGDERSVTADEGPLPGVPSGAPTHGLPSGEETRKAPESASPSAVPSRTAEPSSPRADRDSNAHTDEGVTGSPSPSPSSSRPATGSVSPSGSSEAAEEEGEEPERPEERPDGGTLSPGDSGAEVAVLQRRLKQAGYLAPDAPEDGRYSSTVQEAVFRYQVANRLREDHPGEYGPETRSALESHTSG